MNSQYARKGKLKFQFSQQGLTLISILIILIGFTALVTYNTMFVRPVAEEEMPKAKQADAKPKTAQTASASSSSDKISANAAQTQSAPTVPAKTPETVEEKAMAELNEIKVEESAAQSKKGKITVDGGALVGTISQLVADKYKEFYNLVQVTVGISGTDEGIAAFSAGKLDICGSTRKMTPEEASACRVGFIEVKLAYDTAVVVVNKGNDWANSLTMPELRKMWDSKGNARMWSDVNTGWPGEPLKLYYSKDAPLTQSFFGTALYNNNAAKLSKLATEVETGKEMLAGVAGDKAAVSFCNYITFDSNKDKLKAVGIVGTNGPVIPTYETIKSGAYTPLSRTFYLYVNKNSLQKDYIRDFVKIYMENVSKFVKAGGYLPCDDSEYKSVIDNLPK